MKQPRYETLTLDKIVGGGQALGTLEDGRKAFVWGGLPAEKVTIRVTKKKSKMIEGVVTEVLIPCSDRINPLDPDSYLSTSPWQIMKPSVEQHYKAALIEEAFELHDIVLPNPIELYTNNRTGGYRNKVEFSWFGDTSDSGDTLDLAFFQRGGKGKFPVDSCSLLPDSVMQLAKEVRDLLHAKGVSARQLKTLLIRCNQQGSCVWQLYLKDELPDLLTETEARQLSAQGGELIYSDPRSPASRITKRLASFGDIVLIDTILGVPFRYATEGFFQVNIPVYERALRDMREWISDSGSTSETPSTHDETSAQARDLDETDSRSTEDCLTRQAGSSAGARETESDKPRSAEAVSKRGDGVVLEKREVIDLYSGVGSIGLTIGGDNVTLVEINEDAVREMKRNITELNREDTTKAILAPSERALDVINSDATIILDPPRAGLHADVVAKLIEAAPNRIIYLSCNPVTQARDVALLAERYGIRHHQGYNFFPRTPHIEHLVVLDKLA